MDRSTLRCHRARDWKLDPETEVGDRERPTNGGDPPPVTCPQHHPNSTLRDHAVDAASRVHPEICQMHVLRFGRRGLDRIFQNIPGAVMMDIKSTPDQSGTMSAHMPVGQGDEPASAVPVPRAASMQTAPANQLRGANPQLADNDVEVAIATLSCQQYRVFQLLGRGMANKAIGHTLGIAESTVKTHLSGVFSKLGCKNRTQAARLAVHHQLHRTIPVISFGARE